MSGPGELYHEHIAPVRGLRALQYAYEIGSYHYNWHADVELSVVLTGAVETCVDGEVAVFGPGDVYLFNSNAGHATLALQPRSVVLLLRVDPAYLVGLAGTPAIPRFDCRSTPETRDASAFVRLRRLLALMALHADADAPAEVAAWEGRLLEALSVLFSDFAAGAARGEVDTARNAALGRAIDHVNGHFRERITLDDLARAAGYHPTYLSQVFTQALGMTSTEYLTRLRLRHATRDLGDSSRKVVDVAAANGFPDVKAFNLAFRRTFGKTPTSYRAMLTEAATHADEAFHASYVRRDDPDVRSVLDGFAASHATSLATANAASGAVVAAPAPAASTAATPAPPAVAGHLASRVDPRVDAARAAARELIAALDVLAADAP